MSGSEPWPRKVELKNVTCAFKNATTTVSILHITVEPIWSLTRTVENSGA